MFARKLGDTKMFSQLPWQEVDAESHEQAIESVNSMTKNTYEYLGFARSEVVKLPVIIPFMTMPIDAFAVGY